MDFFCSLYLIDEKREELCKKILFFLVKTYRDKFVKRFVLYYYSVIGGDSILQISLIMFAISVEVSVREYVRNLVGNDEKFDIFINKLNEIRDGFIPNLKSMGNESHEDEVIDLNRYVRLGMLAWQLA